MYTHCPHCRTVFRIYPTQLAQARGQVRCGVCNYCFNALETLSDHLAPLPSSAAPDTTVPERIEHGEPAEHARQSIIEAAVTARSFQQETAADGGGQAMAAAPVAETLAAPSVEEGGETEKTFTAIPAQGSGEAAEPRTEAEITPARKQPFFGTPEPAAAANEAETEVPLSAQPDSALPDLGIIAAEPRPMAAEPNPSHWLKTTLWAAANIVLIAALAGQYAYNNRNDLAQYPELRPWLTQLCVMMACDTPLRRDVDQIVLANRLVESDPNHANALLIDATLVNNADFPQPYPLLEIRFSDLNNQLVAGRRFRPTEYLPPGTTLQAGMAPHQPVHIVLEIADPGKNAVSFQFELL